MVWGPAIGRFWDEAALEDQAAWHRRSGNQYSMRELRADLYLESVAGRIWPRAVPAPVQGVQS